MSKNFSSFKNETESRNKKCGSVHRGTACTSRQTGGDLIFVLVVRINYGISLLCVPAEINPTCYDGHFMSGFIIDDADQSSRRL